MNSKFSHCALVSALVALAALANGNAQVSNINSATYHPREFNDVTNSTLTVISNYPSLIVFDDQNVSAPSGFANRHVWRFSTNSGATAYSFSNNDFFTVTMTLTLTGDPIAPRKEAGFLLDSIGGQGQFIVNTDGHEVVAFGGPFPFYAFPATFNSGDTITLSMTYFMNTNGRRAIIYSANGVQSPIKEFTNLEQGIIDGSTLGGYVQIVNASGVPTNSGTAVYSNIRITGPDFDTDGVADATDRCLNTPFGEVVNAEGCSINQIAPCSGPAGGGTWRNHGHYVRTVAAASQVFLEDGVIDEEQQGAIVSRAAQSDCGRIRFERPVLRGGKPR
jgi:hypothetical protein